MLDLPNIDQVPAAIFQEWLGSLPSSDLVGAALELGAPAPVMQLKVWLDEFVPTPVPEPETWLLMIGGLAGVGAVLRRRRAEDAAETP